MATLLGWFQLLVLVLAGGLAIGALGASLAGRLWLDRLEAVAPRPRFWIVAAILLMPVLVGFAAVGVSVAPSVLDMLGIVADHCAHHGGHDFHLCFVHGHPPSPVPLVLGSAAVAGLWLLATWADEIERIRQVGDWSRRLVSLARYEDAIAGWRVRSDRPLAVTVGLLRPRVLVSDGLAAQLTDEQHAAVIAHEQAHARRFDALVKFIVRLASVFVPSGVRSRLVVALDLACEQACDEAAAAAVGDRLCVADAIVAVGRALDGGPEAPVAALGFDAGVLERRVRSLLDNDWRPARNTALLPASVVLFLLWSYEHAHHSIESLLSHLF